MFSCGSAAAFMQGIRGWGNETGAALVGMRGGNEEARVRDEDDVAGARAATLARANGPLAVRGRFCCPIWAEGRAVGWERADKIILGSGAYGAPDGLLGSADCTRDHAGPDCGQLQGKGPHSVLQQMAECRQMHFAQHGAEEGGSRRQIPRPPIRGAPSHQRSAKQHL